MSHVRGLIDAVLTGKQLTRADDEALRAHLRGCATCREHFDEGMLVLRAARGGESAYAPGELARLVSSASSPSRPAAAPAGWRWQWALAGAAAIAVLVGVVFAVTARHPVGRVLEAGRGFTVDGVEAVRDAEIRSNAVLATAKEDAAVLLEGAHGRRGLLLRPGTTVRARSSDEVTIDGGRLRVQLRQGDPLTVRAPGGTVVASAGTFVVERREDATLIAVHQGTVQVIGRDTVTLSEGEETELGIEGEVAPARTAGPRALIEDRGDGSVWDAILRFLRSLLDVISRALAGE